MSEFELGVGLRTRQTSHSSSTGFQAKVELEKIQIQVFNSELGGGGEIRRFLLVYHKVVQRTHGKILCHLSAIKSPDVAGVVFEIYTQAFMISSKSAKVA